MNTLLSWVKTHKLFLILLVLVLLFIAGQQSKNWRFLVHETVSITPQMMTEPSGYVASKQGMRGQTADLAYPLPAEMSSAPSAPTTRVDRIVHLDTSLSMQVSDVRDAIEAIEGRAKEMGGFLVDSTVNIPTYAATGTITVRVPSEKRSEALSSFRTLGVKVVNENVTGQDVTDQFVDNEARLQILETTKAKFEAILASATTVQDMLSVQRELLSVQSQIDSLKGQQLYLEQNGKLSRIAIFLSTDDLALPYTPDDAWRPQVVFKLAVRSLVGSLRDVLDTAIWIGVYAPIWLPLTIIGYLVYRKLNKK